MNNNKWIDLNILTYTVNKLKELINKKADMKHGHLASEITEETNRKFVTTSEKEKIHVIQTDGDGSSILYSDGTYKKASSGNVIHDGIVADDTTYSSKKIDTDFSKKTHTHKEFDKLNADSHTHSNKNVLDDISLERFSSWDYKTQKIITVGQGNMFLADDGEYKERSGGGIGEGGVSSWSDLADKPFESIDPKTLNVDSRSKTLSANRVEITLAEYDKLLQNNQINENMMYLITDDNNYSNYIDDFWYGTRLKYEEMKKAGTLNPNTTYFTTDDGDYLLKNNILFSDEQINFIKNLVQTIINKQAN